MADFDRRLATTVLKGYFDCSGLEAIYKVRICDILWTIMSEPICQRNGFCFILVEHLVIFSFTVFHNSCWLFDEKLICEFSVHSCV